MKNLQICLPLVNGDLFPLDYSNGCELIDHMVTDDLRPPPRSLCFEATTEDGKKVTITIPYSNSDEVAVCIDDGE